MLSALPIGDPPFATLNETIRGNRAAFERGFEGATNPMMCLPLCPSRNVRNPPRGRAAQLGFRPLPEADEVPVGPRPDGEMINQPINLFYAGQDHGGHHKTRGRHGAKNRTLRSSSGARIASQHQQTGKISLKKSVSLDESADPGGAPTKLPIRGTSCGEESKSSVEDRCEPPPGPTIRARSPLGSSVLPPPSPLLRNLGPA